MNSQYQSVIVRYERRGSRVQPIRVTRQWVEPAGGSGERLWMVVRVTEVPWSSLSRERVGRSMGRGPRPERMALDNPAPTTP